MKNITFVRVLLITTYLLLHAAAVGGEFTQSLTPEKLQASGLVKLTPAEIAQLESLIENYKTGAVEKAVAAVPPAPPAVKPAPVTKSGGIMPDWVGALITLKRSEKGPAAQQTLESMLVGDFSGWSGRTSFKLENGQLWIQANSDSYQYSPVLNSPKVKIYPASLGNYWMEIEGTNQRCRVKPISLE